MDNLTHTLTGIMLSRAGLARLTPRASWILALAANVPDIDVFWSAPMGAPAYLDAHRGISHAAVMAPVFALLPVAAVGLWRRPAAFPWLRACIAANIGVASHLALDLTNIYGIRLALPFHGHWYRLDWTNVVDPWIWAVLFIAILWPMLARLVSSEIGGKSKAGPGIARFALAFLCLYQGARAVLHARAVATLDSHIYQGETPRRVMAMPGAWNPFRWRGLVELSGAWIVTGVNLASEFDPASGDLYYKPESQDWIAKARQTVPFQTLERFSSTLFWRVTPLPEPEAGTEVICSDLRFGDPGSGAFRARARFNRDGRLLESAFGFRGR
jgi:inner membrane protein